MTSAGADDAGEQRQVLVSACLLGIDARYDGGNCHRPELLEELDDCSVVPVCPERLGDLPTPRPPAEITEGDGVDVLKGEASVVDSEGRDVTENFLRGARQVKNLADRLDIEKAYLKEGSPSCGVTVIVRDDREVSGRGVAAALLADSGVEVKGIR